MFIPYAYQSECLDRLAQARRSGRTQALVIMASGLGKTVTAALDVRSWFEKHDGRMLYLCHQNDILEQARTTFELVLGSGRTYGYFHGREKDRRPVSCLFASFQTMRQRKWQKKFQPDEFDYIVVDESHHGPARTYRPVLEYFKPKFLLGITATPERTDLQDIRRIYGDEVYSLPLDEALARELLTPVSYYLVTDELQNLKILDTPVGKLSIKKLNKQLFVPQRDEEIARIIKRHTTVIENPRLMIFGPSIAYCDRFGEYFPGSFPIHSKQPHREQYARLSAFRQGRVNTALTVDKFNEGIDIPDANAIVFLRSTASRRIFFQQLGRGLRKFPGKEQVLVLDFVANCERLEAVHTLWAEVEERRAKLHKTVSPISVSVGNVQFTEVAKRVIDVISRIRSGYSREMLIKQLHDLGEKVKRTPRKDDVLAANERGECASIYFFRTNFGSLRAALQEAGYAVPPPRYEGMPKKKRRLITQILKLERRLKRKVTAVDLTTAAKAKKCPSISAFQRQFGSLTAALVEAGQRRIPIRRSRPAREELLIQLRRLIQEQGSRPSYRDVLRASKKGECSHPKTFAKIFGSLSAALEAATA